MRENLFYRIVDAREPLLDRLVLVRESLANCVAFLAKKQGISVTCVQTNITSSAESAIARSVYRLRRGFAIYDCNVGPITWGNQEMSKHFTDVELASTSH